MLKSITDRFVPAIAKRYREASGLYKYGLKYDDILRESPQMLEALKRLPEAELVARDQRLKRAFDLSQKKQVLPEAERMSDEHNTPYLRPVVEEVEKEHLERKAWRV